MVFKRKKIIKKAEEEPIEETETVEEEETELERINKEQERIDNERKILEEKEAKVLKELPEIEPPKQNIQIISESELINWKLDKILEILEKEV